ncbi:cellulase family glycosylhydrolase [Desertivirga xinjiangensis]|uniref:cellulase family glycosylhydrolase n=1 Tax=Desertivirga xinjiangensis TaxID=539206 RepID=UPI00210CDFB2|nr:cellulase family glycosylhydrolase [Pedobacter xinjiangensis]
MTTKRLFFSLLLVVIFVFQKLSVQAQTGKAVFVDKEGVLRWKDTKKEVAFFGVNYTTPFAYGYRAAKALDVNPEEVIKQDVYHMARLGLDAFRVHVWDTEISDSAGNLLNNEHLRLFDFLLAELKKRNIKTIITPIAFWGNGYPEKDEKTPGFSAKYGKGQSLVKEEAIKAQENYLEQFFKHVNPYTSLRYLEDDAVIAAEINNEPQHSGSKEGAKNYINRLAAVIRASGWTKPVFYNISESPFYADAIANANIDGLSFQWYPTGLVANHTLKGNFLPNVDQYRIPFDSIPAFKDKARMVYEFDAGDVVQPVMYPAMARSFRTAGFQWATQFAYDPITTAFANTEYQTHYLNLAYTPAKAISLLIANKVFHQVPRLKSYGSYPQNTQFGNFRINYQEGLSEMNSGEEFYHTASTSSRPASVSKLKKIAGVGSSTLVTYTGSGAYFLDKLQDGVWRLEVMPDAIQIRDPFERASLKKEVTRIEYKNQEFTLTLPDLGQDFGISVLNSPYAAYAAGASASGKSFRVYPGTYLLVNKQKSANKLPETFGENYIGLKDFVAPKALSSSLIVRHDPLQQVSEGRSFTVKATVAGLEQDAKLELHANQLNGEYKTIPMSMSTSNEFVAEIPASFVIPGLLKYRIVVKNGADEVIFPGNYKQDRDNFSIDSWETYVAAKNSSLEIYNAREDQMLRSVPNWDKTIKTSYVTSGSGNRLLYQVQFSAPLKEGLAGFELYIGDKLEGRASELTEFTKLVVKGRSTSPEGTVLKFSLTDQNANTVSAKTSLKYELTEIEIPLSEFQEDKFLLLPRPYPGFQNLWFDSSFKRKYDPAQLEKLQVSLSDLPKITTITSGFLIESVQLKK